MAYGIIGSGKVGTALATLFSRAGIEVAIVNTREPETIKPLAEQLGATVKATSLQDAVAADVVLLAIPFIAVETFVSFDKRAVEPMDTQGVAARLLA